MCQTIIVKYIFVCFSIVLYCQSCAYDPPKKPDISIENNTDSAIYAYYSFHDSLELARPIFLFEKNIEYYSPTYRANAYTFGGIRISERDFFDKTNGIINIFFIQEKTMRDYTWEEICKKQMYIKKESFTRTDLEKNNWTIRYP